MPHPKEKKQQQRALLNSTKESKTHLGQFLVVLLLDYTSTFSFTLSKLVFVSPPVIICKNHIRCIGFGVAIYHS